MRIAFAISNFDSDDSNAEMTALYLDWARIPALKGHEVIIYTLSEKGESQTVVDGVKICHLSFDPESYKELTEFTFAPVLSWFLPRSIALYRQCKIAYSEFKPDIVHCIKPLDSLLWSSQGEYPVVIQSVSPQFELMRLDFEKQYVEFDTSVMQALETMGYALADAITVPSQTLANVISEGAGLAAERIQTIAAPIGIKTNETSINRPRGKDFPHILHAAGVEKLKGVDTLIEALNIVARKFPGAKLRIAGEEPPTIGSHVSFSDGVKQRISELGLTKNVEFLGIRPRAEIRQFMLETDVFVFPLLYCGCPYACMEAMACGAPIVATKTGAIAEYLEDGKSGLLIEPDSPESLARAIIQLAEDRNLADSLGISAQKAVAEMCAPEKISEAMDALYKRARDRFETRSKEDQSAIRTAVAHALEGFDQLCKNQFLKRLFEEKFREGAAHSLDEMRSPRTAFKRAGFAGGMAALALRAGNWPKEN